MAFIFVQLLFLSLPLAWSHVHLLRLNCVKPQNWYIQSTVSPGARYVSLTISSLPLARLLTGFHTYIHTHTHTCAHYCTHPCQHTTHTQYEIATNEPMNPIKQDEKKGELRVFKKGDIYFNYGCFPRVSAFLTLSLSLSLARSLVLSLSLSLFFLRLSPSPPPVSLRQSVLFSRIFPLPFLVSFLLRCLVISLYFCLSLCLSLYIYIYIYINI